MSSWGDSWGNSWDKSWGSIIVVVGKAIIKNLYTTLEFVKDLITP